MRKTGATEESGADPVNVMGTTFDLAGEAADKAAKVLDKRFVPVKIPVGGASYTAWKYVRLGTRLYNPMEFGYITSERALQALKLGKVGMKGIGGIAQGAGIVKNFLDTGEAAAANDERGVTLAGTKNLFTAVSIGVGMAYPVAGAVLGAFSDVAAEEWVNETWYQRELEEKAARYDQWWKQFDHELRPREEQPGINLDGIESW